MVRRLPCKVVVAGAAAAIAALALAPSATATVASGAIERAEADADWTAGSIAGIVYRPVSCVTPAWPKPAATWPGGPEPPPEPAVYFSPCAWIPYATLGSVPCSSPDRSLANPGPGVQVVWSGGEREGAGSAPFDLPALALAHGAAAPLLCLSAIEATAERVACAAAMGVVCPPYAIVGRPYELDSAVLKARPAFVSASPVPSPPGAAFSGEEARSENRQRRRCRRAGQRPKPVRRASAKAGKRAGHKRCRRR